MSKPDAWQGDWVATAITGVRRGAAPGSATLLLTELAGPREFSAPLAADAAHQLAHEFHQDPTRYSLSCRLLEEIISWVGGRVTAVRVTGNGTATAVGEIELEIHGERRLMNADPGEAVLLAWRQALPIFVEAACTHVEASIERDDAAIHQLRQLLQHVTPEAFAR